MGSGGENRRTENHALDTVLRVDSQFMERAIELARRSFGQTRPNPIVGAIVVRDGVIVGEGYHRRAGGAHAEVEALANAGTEANGATLYVTLEPCNHSGRTPPCTDAIFKAGIQEVVFAVSDPVDHGCLCGKDRLLRDGVRVREGICAAMAAYDNRFFLNANRRRKPWVIAKYASSLDGRIATSTGESQWITGPEARRRGHELRSFVDAVVVGSGTILADDPRLTVRLDSFMGIQPACIVLDSRGRVPVESKFVSEPGRKVILVTTDLSSPGWRQEMRDREIELVTLARNSSNHLSLQELMRILFDLGMQSLLVEGGAHVLGGFFDDRLVDEVWAFLAPMVIGGVNSPAAIGGVGALKLRDAHELDRVQLEKLGPDILMQGLVRQVEVPETCLRES
jgi:diaminohydroxyphosphoribosylaminopyrimidine deaminase/5-amino-6-(5-phosphoribosylamino)uracil reductase